MRKKRLAVLAVVAVLVLAGCQNTVSTDAPEATVTVAPTKEAEVTNVPESTAPTATEAPMPESTKVPSPTQIPETDVSDLEFEIKEDGTIRITDAYVERVRIPAMINGLPVTEIGEGAFYDTDDHVSIEIPASVISIEEQAFCYLGKLVSLRVDENNPKYTSRDENGNECNAIIDKETNTLIAGCSTTIIPDTVAHIGNYAFSGSELTDIEIPFGVITIGNESFTYCRNLTSIIIPGSVTSIGEDAFSYCWLTSIILPDSVTEIGEHSERLGGSNCEYYVTPKGSYAEGWLEENGVSSSEIVEDISEIVTPTPEETYIPTEAPTAAPTPAPVTDAQYFKFEQTDDGNIRITGLKDNSLNEAVIPDKIDGIPVTEIGEYAFYKCFSLTSITIPSSVTEIEDSAFYDCSSLTSITIPSSVTEIGEYAFGYCSSLTSITIPDSVTVIGEGAFCGCRSLTSITVPDSVTEIGEEAFGYCSSLTSITIPDSVTVIGEFAFDGCINLTSITIPSSVTEIGGCAFIGCSSLTSITIPSSVTEIGDGAFYDCSSLTSITIPSSVTEIGDSAFYGCEKFEVIFAPKGSYAEQWAKDHGYNVVSFRINQG